MGGTVPFLSGAERRAYNVCLPGVAVIQRSAMINTAVRPSRMICTRQERANVLLNIAPLNPSNISFGPHISYAIFHNYKRDASSRILHIDFHLLALPLEKISHSNNVANGHDRDLYRCSMLLVLCRKVSHHR